LLKKTNNSKYHFSNPCWNNNRKRLYFSSDLPGGKGGMDIWYIETTGDSIGIPVNAKEFNTPSNELSPTLPRDTLTILVHDEVKNQYDISMFYKDIRQSVYVEKKPVENILFTCSPRKGILFFVSSDGTKHSLWHGSWKYARLDNISTIASESVEQLQSENEPAHDLAKQTEIATNDASFSLTNYFGVAQYELTPIMKDSLDNIAAMLNNNPSLNIVICGHASPDGPEDLNMMISYYRANEAYKRLLGDSVKKERIFRIYGGEYLYTDSVKARMFSIFTLLETDLPDQAVIVPVNSLGNSNDVLQNFGTDKDETDYWRFVLKKQLPSIDDKSLLLFPVKNIYYTQQKETISKIATQNESTIENLLKANNLNDKFLQPSKVLYIPKK